MAELLDDPVALTAELLRLDTVNPPGNESIACDLLEPLLRAIGLTTERIAFAPGRESLIAMPSGTDRPLLCFTGHLDTVPLGFVPWSHAPHGAEVDQGRLYGRGSSDMKGGIAAFICATARYVRHVGRPPPVMLVLTAAEETGAEGARSLLPLKERRIPVAALLVGEPTANRLVIGHKGALWLKAEATGTAAHGSMPERGDNAIYKVADAIQRIRHFRVEPALCDLLGPSTLNVGTVQGGMNVNSVPDRAQFQVDIRTVGPGPNADVQERLQSYLGDHIRLRAEVDVPSMQTDPDHPWIAAVAAAVTGVTGEACPRKTVSFFTDGPALRDIWGNVPTAIVGPGEPACAHAVDEYCEVGKLHAASRIYEAIIAQHAGR